MNEYLTFERSDTPAKAEGDDCPLETWYTMDQRSRFIDEEIEVRFAQKPGPPTSFIWHGQEYGIVEIERAYRRLDFKRPWWRRRHRDYYRVKTDTGQVFEIYFNRGPGRRYWVLYRKFIV